MMMNQRKNAERCGHKKRYGLLLLMLAVMLLAMMLGACTSKAEPDENSGLYEAVSVKAFGFEMAVDEIFDEAITIELKDGGKAVFTYEGKSYNMKWSRSGSDFEAKGGGAELSGTVKDGVMELTDILSSGVDITLECADILRRASKENGDETEWATDDGMDMFVFAGDGDDTEAGASAQTLSDEQMKLIRLYEGDWYGMIRINHAYDGYSEYADLETLVTARFSFDEEGDTSAWLCANLTPTPSNFQNVTAEMTPSGDTLTLRFDFFEGSTKDNVYLRVDRGLLNCTADIINDKGDEMDISFALRRVGEEWTEDENFYWNHAAGYAHLSEGMTAEELAQAWIGDQYPKPVIALSDIGGGGGVQNTGGSAPGSGGNTAGEAPGQAAPSAAAADFDSVMDYESKGILYLRYPSDTYAFSHSIFDRLEANDGHVRMSFNAEGSGTNSLDAMNEKLDKFSTEPEYNSENVTIAGYPARVVKYQDSTMFNQPTMNVLIDITDTNDRYILLSVTVTGKSMDDLDDASILAVLSTLRFTP